MGDKYLIIQKNGQILKPEVYLKARKGGKDFRAFIKREALKEGLLLDSKLKSKKPDYLFYAKKLGFDWEKNADYGFLNYDYKAQLIMRLVKDYARQLVKKIGFPIYEVRGSNVFDLSHPVVQAYSQLYGDRLFKFPSGKKWVVMGYDASYPQFNLAGQYRLSYKQLPWAHFSISDCYRHEQSGECMLLYRLRRFFMPDLHPYFANIDQAFAWYLQIQRQILGAAKEVKRNYQVVAEVSSWENWQKYQEKIGLIAQNLNQDILVAIMMDKKDRYWVINVDYKIIDQLGQSREIGCIQIDVGNSQRLGIEYVNKSGQKVHPIIIHAAVPGGIERFLYLLFDNFKVSFPLWLYPAQVRLLPISRDYFCSCQALVKNHHHLPVRIEIDDRDESLGKKVKSAHEDLIPFPIVIGKREASAKKVEKLDRVIKKILKSAKDKPFFELGYPVLLSRQLR